MPPAIRTLAFDFGNVLAHFDYGRIYDRLGPLLGRSGLEVKERLAAEGFSALLGRFERGELSGREFAACVKGKLGLAISDDAFRSIWVDIFTLNEPLAGMIPNLKRRGYGLILGSNTNEWHFAHYRSAFAEPLDHFDGFVTSHEVGAEKPSERFFEALLRVAGRPAEECLFIDDMEENVAGARRLGIPGIVYREAGELVRELERRGVSGAG